MRMCRDVATTRSQNVGKSLQYVMDAWTGNSREHPDTVTARQSVTTHRVVFDYNAPAAFHVID